MSSAQSTFNRVRDITSQSLHDYILRIKSYSTSYEDPNAPESLPNFEPGQVFPKAAQAKAMFSSFSKINLKTYRNENQDNNFSVGGLYPDIVRVNTVDNQVFNIEEIETEVGEIERDEWLRFAKLDVANFIVVVPEKEVKKAKRLIDRNKIPVKTLVSYETDYPVSKKVIFTEEKRGFFGHKSSWTWDQKALAGAEKEYFDSMSTMFDKISNLNGNPTPQEAEEIFGPWLSFQTCRYCHATNRKEARYCEKCGKKLTSS